jgi:hypothetical protein
MYLVGRAMHTRGNRIPPALKHGAYAATSVLPGESQADLEKLHRNIIAELAPSGVLEDDIVMTIAHLVWRKQNLGVLRISELAQRLWAEAPEIGEKAVALKNFLREVSQENLVIMEEKLRANCQALENLGDTFELVEIGDAATFDGLKKELDVKERLDAAIARCLKQLLLVRGVKSLSEAPPSASLKRIPTKAA